MIENRPFSTFLAHLVLWIGVAIVALPLYVTFVASTLSAEQVLQSPISMIPGDQLLNNYKTVLFAGAGNQSAQVGRMMVNSLIMALVIAVGKIVISMRLLTSGFRVVSWRSG